MGRREAYGTYAASWTPPSYTVDDRGKVVGGYHPPGRHNWGRWGEDDRRGTANLIGPEQLRNAAALVRRGRAFSLSHPVDATSPRFQGRPAPKHYFMMTGSDAVVGSPVNAGFEGFVWNDDCIDMALQSSTQWDGLAHVQVDDTLYNGFWAGSITAAGGSPAVGIGALNESFSGRGILLDVARSEGVERLEPGQVITPAMLERAVEAAGLAIEVGDIVLIRTGHVTQWASLVTEEEKNGFVFAAPGIGMAAADWLAERDVAAVVSDTTGLEVAPSEGDVQSPVHRFFLVDLGLTIGELWNLEELAEDCAQDGAYAFLLVAPPLYLPRAVGSPLNPTAIK